MTQKYPVHPSADLFPMLDQDQLASLARSITENGQRFPIMLWKNGSDTEVVIDGRNRLTACELAQIEPKFEHFEGTEEDVAAYISDVNLERRDLKDSQKVMARAMLYPVAGKVSDGGRGKKGETVRLSDSLGLKKSQTANLLAKARKLLAFKDEQGVRLYPDLVKSVLNGVKDIGKALEEAQRRELEVSSEETQLAELRKNAPELAELVPGKMTLSEALAAYQQRLDDEAEFQKARCDSIHRGIVTTAQNLWGFGTATTAIEDLPLVLEDDDFLKRIDGLGGLMWEFVDPEAFRAGTERLIEMIKAIKEKKYGAQTNS